MIAIRGLAGIVTGRIDRPRDNADTLIVDGGRIVGPDAVATDVIDARGRWAVPGGWDGSASLYYGDHEPTYSARGHVAGAVVHGTTTLVIGGPVAIPGWIGTPRSRRELAVLTIKSWRHDRPRGIKVVAGVVDADAGWDERDLTDLAAVGATTLMLSTAQSADDTRRLAGAARSVGLRTGLRVISDTVGGKALSSVLAAAQPDVVVTSRDGSHTVVNRVLTSTHHASVGLLLTGELGEAAEAINAAADSDQLDRLFLGTGMPGRAGVLPGGLALFVDILERCTSIGRDRLLALASGNVARAFGLPGGVLEFGQPADLVLVDPAQDGRGPSSAWTNPPEMTMIDGVVAWSRDGSQ